MTVSETLDHGVDGAALMAEDGPLPADPLFDSDRVPGDNAPVAGRLLELDRDLSMPAVPEHLVWMHLSTADTGEPLAVQATGGETPGHRETAPAGLTLLPAGAETLWHYHGLAEALCWPVSPADLEVEAVALDLDPDRMELRACVGDPNALIHALAWATVRECRRAGPTMSLYLDALRVSMMVEVIHARAVRAPVRTVDAMGASRVRSAIDYVHANLSYDLRLAGIARAVGVSPHQLARGFRREMGLPLHRYVLRQRVAAGRSLLVRTDLPIATIADEVGFADQSHFTRCLRRLYDITPSQLRADVGADQELSCRGAIEPRDRGPDEEAALGH